MLVSDFDFYLPSDLIAQEPLRQRDTSRMLVLDRGQGTFSDCRFLNLPALLREGDCLVLNDTRVFPARLVGVKPGYSARVEIFLIREQSPDVWEALVKPGRALRAGAKASFGDGCLWGEVLEVLEDGHRLVRLTASGRGVGLSVRDIIDEIGLTPLPPYIKRNSVELDRQSYQTVYARERGSIAAPTAGLHFTEQVLNSILERGVAIARITHHVGYATFQPVRVERVEEHRIGLEEYEISVEAATLINSTRAQGGRIVAVGTTSTRALESASDADGLVVAGRGRTELFIYPGYRFKVVDALLTNFHLPRSSLLMLVSAFAGRSLVLAAYRHAVAERYRFYSYGDCMFIS